MVVLGVIPGKVPSEIGDGLSIVQEAIGVFWSSFYRAESRLDKRIVFGGSRARKQLRDAVMFAQLLDWLGLHLEAAVIDEFGALLLRQVPDSLLNQAAFRHEASVLGCLLPTDAPF